MPRFDDLLGTSIGFFQLAIRGVRLKNVGGNLAVRNPGDTQDAELTTLKLNNTSNVISIGATNPLTLQRNTAQASNLAIVFPSAKSSDGYALTQRSGTASGTLELELTPVSNASSLSTDTTTINASSSATTPLFTLPANAVVDKVVVIVDNAFNGTPTLDIGIAGDTSKYFPSSKVDLTDAGKSYGCYPDKSPSGGSESLIATYTANGANAGSARVLVSYAIPA